MKHYLTTSETDLAVSLIVWFILGLVMLTVFGAWFKLFVLEWVFKGIVGC